MKKTLRFIAAGVFCMAFSSTAQANLLTNGDFDVPISGLTGTDWNVYDSIEGWTKGLGTSGIEVQRDTIVPADSSAQYVELDSSGGTDTNSSMFQSISLAAGSYVLDWMYHARTNNDDNDNGIRAYVTDSNESEISLGYISKTYDPQKPDIWEQISWTFTIGNTGNYKLWFAAFGKDNELGGFIDSVSLTAVPEPATMLLFGAGLAGLAGLRRRKE